MPHWVAEHAETEEEVCDDGLFPRTRAAVLASLKATVKIKRETFRNERWKSRRSDSGATTLGERWHNPAKVHIEKARDGDMTLVNVQDLQKCLDLEKEKAKVENLLADAKEEAGVCCETDFGYEDAEEDEDEESFLKKLKQHLGDTILEQDSNGFRGVSPALANSDAVHSG